MINAEFLANCSDEQINKGVGWIEIIRLSRMLPSYCVNAGNIGSGASAGLLKTNYCANPNDTMPIAFANNISITTKPADHIGKPFAFSTGVLGRTVHCDSNSALLRAICEVYILMSVNK